MKQRNDKRNTIDDTPQMVQCSVSHNSLRGGAAVGTRTPTTLISWIVINVVKPTQAG